MKCQRCGSPIPQGENACASCGTVIPGDDGEGLSAGTVIGGKYEIVEPIGAGGMGRIYRAIQTPLGTDVCVKTLHTRATEPEFAARFLREAKATSGLRHPHIVNVFDFGTHTDGALYLVMEYIKGQSLAEAIKKGTYLPAERAVRILGQLCDALTAAHAQGVIHRDLKPANIMLQQVEGMVDHVKVLDFGSALMLEGEGSERLTQMGMVIGTPAYMAPEYIMGRGVTPRVDVYAVGVLLYRLLSGKQPFRGTTQAIYAQQVTFKPEPPSAKTPEAKITPALDRVVMRALVKDPAERYASAADLKEAMVRALSGEADEDDDFEFSVDDDGGVAIELAAQERAVVVASIRGVRGLDEELVERVKELARTHGAAIEVESEELTVVFGFTQEGEQASVDTTRFALKVLEAEGKALRLGIFDDQASVRGKPGTPGFGYKLFGEGKVRAAYLSRLAPPGQVLVSGLASRGVASEFRLVPTAPPSEFIDPVFVVTDAKESRRRGGWELFVGRDEEKQALVELAVEAAKGRVCLLLGPEGIGKSRLVEEVTPQVGHLDVHWCVVPAPPPGPIGPTHPASVLSALGWGLNEGSGSTTYRYMVHLMLGRAEQRVSRLRGERRMLRLVSAAIGGLQQRLERGPVVVVFDEMHQADDLTWTLAQRLIDVAPELGVSVVLCLREESQVPFSLPASTTRIRLGPLPDKEALLLMEISLGGELDQGSLTLAAGVTQGHPLLLQELIRTVEQEQPAWLYKLAELEPREALSRLVEVRLKKLEAPAVRLMGAAAVLGGEPLALEVMKLSGVGPDQVSAQMIQLETGNLLHRVAGGRFRFAFPQVGQVVLKGLTPETLAKLHLRAAQIIDDSELSDMRQVEMGEHLLRAGQHAEAFALLRGAGLAAQDDGRKQLATHALSLAIEAGNSLGTQYNRERAETARDLGRWLIQLGNLSDAEALLRAAYHLAQEVSAGDLCSDLLRLHGRTIVLKGDLEAGRQEIEATLEFALRNGDILGAAKACVDLADAAEKAGDREGRARALKRGVGLLEGRDRAGAAKVWIQLYNRMGRLEAESKNLPRAVALFAQALELAEQQDDQYQKAGLLGNLGGAYAQLNDAAKAIHYIERALRASENLGDQIGIARQSFNLALLRLTAGQDQAAKDLLRGSYDAASRAGWREGLTMSKAAMAKLGMAV